MLIVVSLPFFIAYFVFPNTMMNIFVKSSETGIIDVGRIFLKIVTPFYFVISAKLTFDGILRGSRNMAFLACRLDYRRSYFGSILFYLL